MGLLRSRRRGSSKCGNVWKVCVNCPDAVFCIFVVQGRKFHVIIMSHLDVGTNYKLRWLLVHLGTSYIFSHLHTCLHRFVAIFDADFEPPEDFLEQTVPLLANQPNLGFVQTRWLSPSSSFLTWAQVAATRVRSVCAYASLT